IRNSLQRRSGNSPVSSIPKRAVSFQDPANLPVFPVLTEEEPRPPCTEPGSRHSNTHVRSLLELTCVHGTISQPRSTTYGLSSLKPASIAGISCISLRRK